MPVKPPKPLLPDDTLQALVLFAGKPHIRNVQGMLQNIMGRLFIGKQGAEQRKALLALNFTREHVDHFLGPEPTHEVEGREAREALDYIYGLLDAGHILTVQKHEQGRYSVGYSAKPSNGPHNALARRIISAMIKHPGLIGQVLQITQWEQNAELRNGTVQVEEESV